MTREDMRVEQGRSSSSRSRNRNRNRGYADQGNDRYYDNDAYEYDDYDEDGDEEEHDNYHDDNDGGNDDDDDLIVAQYFKYDGTPAHPDDKVSIVQRAPLREWRRIMDKEDGNVRYEM